MINKLKKLSKHLFIGALILILLTATGASCSKKSVSGGKSKEPITINVWHLYDEEEVFKPIIDAYQKNNPNVKIKFSKKAPEEYEETSVDALASQEGPDIWLIRNDWVYKHQKKLVAMPDGLLKNNDKDKRSNVEIYKDAFVPVISQDLISDNKVYALPLYVDTLALYWNRDLINQTKRDLERKGTKLEGTLLSQAPATWDEVIQNAKLLTKKDKGDITQAGLAFGTNSNIDHSYDILTALMLQNNTAMISDDKKTATFNLPIKKETGEPVYSGTAALDFYTSFADQNKESYSWSGSMGDALTAFMQGKLAMMVGYGYLESTIKQQAPKLIYNTAPLPQIKGATAPVDYASYWVETVTKNSKHPEIAWDYLKYIYQNGMDSYLSSSGRVSPRKLDSEVDISQRPGRSNPFRFQTMSAKSWFKGKYPLKVDTIFAQMIDNISVYRQPLQTAIDTAAKEVTALLQK